MASLIGELSAQLTERFFKATSPALRPPPYQGRHNPYGPSQAILARQVPTNGRRRTVARTDSRGSWSVAPLIGELSAQLTERFSRQPLRPYGHLPYQGRHNPHGPSQAILARQVPTNRRRRTAARTDSRGSWSVAPLIGELSAQLTKRFSRQPLRPYGHLPIREGWYAGIPGRRLPGLPGAGRIRQ